MRKNIFKTTVIAMAVLTVAFGMTACGKKNNTVKDNDTTVTQENVTTADKNNTKKSSKVVFDYTDADGVTTKLEGNATVSDNGEAVIEVIDNNGNKAIFTGKASTDNGKLSVSDIKVKDASTLVKTDGTEVKVSEDAKIEDATESTEATNADVAAEEPKEDTIVADGSDSNVSEGNKNAGDNGADNGNVSDTPSNEPVETPDVPNTPSEPEYVPDVPSEPEPTPTPEPQPVPQEPQPSEPELQAKTPVYCDMDFRTSDGVEDTRDATVGEYIFRKYINGEITESEAESLMLNGALINVKVRYDDGSEEIIDEIKPTSVKMSIAHTGEEYSMIEHNWHIPGYTYVSMSDWRGATHAVYYMLIYYDI